MAWSWSLCPGCLQLLGCCRCCLLATGFCRQATNWKEQKQKKTKGEKRTHKKKNSSGQTVAPCQSPHMILTPNPKFQASESQTQSVFRMCDCQVPSFSVRKSVGFFPCFSILFFLLFFFIFFLNMLRAATTDKLDWRTCCVQSICCLERNYRKNKKLPRSCRQRCRLTLSYEK